jgi:hypothetical protein
MTASLNKPQINKASEFRTKALQAWGMVSAVTPVPTFLSPTVMLP